MKRGDKVVCISNLYSYKLKLYDTYIIVDIIRDDDNSIRYIRIDREFFRYYPHRFITLKEYRKLKLIKLKHV